ncbi:unnamed protein product [Rotaria socialis]
MEFNLIISFSLWMLFIGQAGELQETFLQASPHDRLPNGSTFSPYIRSILHLHGRIPFTKLTEPRPDNAVDNEFN